MITEERMAKLEAQVAELLEAAKPVDLQDKYRNEPLRKSPSAKYWTGRSLEGLRPAQLTAEECDAVAKWKEACVYMAEKETDPTKKKDPKYIGYDRRDARWFRAMAAHKRVTPGAVDNEPAPF